MAKQELEKVKFELRDVEKLIPYANNSRTHSEEQIQQVVNSIKEFGFINPVIVAKDGVIIAGHCRVLAAKRLGMKRVPCVLQSHLTPTQLRAYVIADNQLALNAGWDEETLAKELAAIQTDGFDLDLLGFSTDELEQYLKDDNADLQASEDGYDETQSDIPKRCKRGDVWQCGDHRLMCGDSTSAEDWKKLMRDDKADMCFTDPPYGVAIGDKNKMLNEFQKSGRVITNIKADTLPPDELYKMLVNAMTNVRLNCKDDASYFVTSPQGGELGLMMMMKDSGLQVRHMLIWEKNCATFSMGRLDYDYQHEPIFYTWTKSHHNYRKGENRTTIWRYNKPMKCDIHPTMKPVELVANCLKDCTRKNDIVLDAFGGSGTTMIACEQLQRKARLMELDEHYCDVILHRWETLSGKTAKKL